MNKDLRADLHVRKLRPLPAAVDRAATNDQVVISSFWVEDNGTNVQVVDLSKDKIVLEEHYGALQGTSRGGAGASQMKVVHVSRIFHQVYLTAN